jgi:S1-C subfamily serine protease
MNFKQLATATALGWTLSIAQADVPAPQLPAFFDKLNPSMVEVEIHKPDDNRTYSTGTGFLAGSKQWVVTNFHVIDTWVFETEEGIELRINGSNGFKTQAKVVLVDIWNDLALLKLAQPLEAALFEINPALPARGERGYTFGSQLENHTVMAEGIFNGVDERDEDAPAILFTGPVNSGMSGGPVVDAQGKVRGVNHISYPEAQLKSLLVPSDAVAALLKRAADLPQDAQPVDQAELTRQIAEVTQRYTQIFLDTKLQEQTRGRFTLPTKACKTYDHHDYGDEFSGKDSRCRIGFGLPITDAPEAGYGMLKVIWVQTPEMSFFKRRAYLQSEYQALFKTKDTDLSEFMDDWDCSTTEARPIKGTNMRVEFCEREVDTLDGLAHYAARGLSLNGGSEHALFSFYLEGYSLENAEKVLEAVLEKMVFTKH